jgi:hypothetical protein
MVDFQPVEYVSPKTVHRRIVRVLRKRETWFHHSHGVYTFADFGTTEIVEREKLAARLGVLRPWERVGPCFSLQWEQVHETKEGDT